MKTAEEIIREKDREILCVARDTLIREALQIMVSNKVGAILVRENDDIVGVWTERDLLRNTLEEGFDPRTTTVAEVMVSEIHSAPHTDTIYNLMDKFLGLRIRHLPVEKNGEYIGLLSIGDVIRANLDSS
jgi:signal-transduction protein with cAMP-binding, CBS, and nucleotidyltransferase domain